MLIVSRGTLVENDSLRRFERACQKGELLLEQHQIQLLTDYVNQLLIWNSRVNLISRRGTGDVWCEHILPCLIPWTVVRFPSSWQVLDLGTGGGLPGVPLAILRPDLHIVMVDSIGKKTAALLEIVRTIGLPNCSVVTGRIEDLGRDREYARKFDAVVARAVAPLEDLIRWARPVLNLSRHITSGEQYSATGRRSLRGASLVAMKGGDLLDEVKRAILKTREHAIEVLPLPLPESSLTGLVGKKLVVVSFSDTGAHKAT